MTAYFYRNRRFAFLSAVDIDNCL